MGHDGRELPPHPRQRPSAPDTDPTEVARAIVWPGRTATLPLHIDPADDGAEAVNDLGDRTRTQFYTRIGLADLLHPST
jgi:hypothetical protein